MIKKKAMCNYKTDNTLVRKFFICVLILLTYFHCSSASLAAKIVNIDKQEIPGEIPFFDENGKKHFFDQLEGKTLLVIFWATWCASCEKEMPDLDILAKDFRKLPFEIVTLSQDFQGIEIVKKFFESKQIRYLRAYHDYHNQLFAAFSVIGLPSSFLINPDGKMVVVFNGIVDWYDPDIRDILLSHIAGNPETPKNSQKIQSFRKNNINRRNFRQKSKQAEGSSEIQTQSNDDQSNEEHSAKNEEAADLLNVLQ